MPLSAKRAFRQSATSSPEFPQIPQFRDLYPRIGWKPRYGGYTMIAGIPGAMKSLFTTYWIAQMGLPCLYFAADTSSHDASMRLATMALRETEDEIKENDHYREVEEVLDRSNIYFSFGAGLTWDIVNEELDAWVEVFNSYPAIVVIDNLMDMAGCESDYTAQMAAMADATMFCRETGIHTVILHHASDKGFNDPTLPPPRAAIKNGLAEKPEQVITVAIDPNTLTFRVAQVKNRSGAQDASGETYATLKAVPELASFAPYQLST